MNQKDDDPSAANPMLYDPLQGVRITRTKQYLATSISKFIVIFFLFIHIYVYIISLLL